MCAEKAHTSPRASSQGDIWHIPRSSSKSRNLTGLMPQKPWWPVPGPALPHNEGHPAGQQQRGSVEGLVQSLTELVPPAPTHHANHPLMLISWHPSHIEPGVFVTVEYGRVNRLEAKPDGSIQRSWVLHPQPSCSKPHRKRKEGLPPECQPSQATDLEAALQQATAPMDK